MPKEPNTNSPEVFRIHRVNIFLAPFGFVFMGTMAVLMMVIGAEEFSALAPSYENIICLLFGTGLFSAFAFFSLYLFLLALVGRITICGDEVINKGVFKTKRFRLSEVTSLDWISLRPRLGFVVRFQGGKLKILREQFSKKDFHRMVYLFRTGVAEDRQENWISICHYYSTSNDYRDVELNPPDPSKGEMLITRARYNRLGVVFFLLSVLLAVFVLFQDMPELKSLAIFPLVVVFFWLFMRSATPPKGLVVQVHRAKGNKVLQPILSCFVGVVCIFLTKVFPAYETFWWIMGSVFLLPGFVLFLIRTHQYDLQRKREIQEEIERFATEGNLYPEPVFDHLDEHGKHEVELKD